VLTASYSIYPLLQLPFLGLYKCDKNSIGITERVNFVLLFYMVHELPDKDNFFAEIARILQPTGRVLIVEPPFHVSKSDFEISLGKAKAAGLTVSQGPKILLSKTAIL
jgi:SAM-dependent methyltransferase